MRWVCGRALGALAVLGLSSCGVPPPKTVQAPGGTTHALALAPVGFAALPGWRQDRLAEALPSFLNGCAEIVAAAPEHALGGQGEAAALGGTAGQWRVVCDAAKTVPPGDEAAARLFFESRFQPYAVSDGGSAAPAERATGLFTGYWEPEVEGSRSPGGRYTVPLLSRPNDLVQADLGQFAADLKGRALTGRVEDGRLVPYYERADIVEHDALHGKRLEMLWLADPVDAFFLQIQGSGRVRLPNGKVVRVNISAQNGRPYVPIGRVLVQQGELAKDQVTMQSIRAWLDAHPDRAAAMMDANPSYVFFEEVDGLSAAEGPRGALGAPLTPGRSVAVDQRYVPLGAPVWVASKDPVDGAPLQRLMVAQDLGGAIVGPVRADIFFGWGPAAEDRAGRMNAPGKEFLLLPRAAQVAQATQP